jgi:hypothetical protein
MGISIPKVSSFSSFTNKVEKHLNDVKKNKAYLSNQVSGALRAKKNQAASYFASNNIEAFSKFTALTTAFGYDKKARLINGVSQASDTDKAIKKAVKDGEELKVKMDELVKQYEQAKES